MFQVSQQQETPDLIFLFGFVIWENLSYFPTKISEPSFCLGRLYTPEVQLRFHTTVMTGIHYKMNVKYFRTSLEISLNHIGT